MKEPDKWCIKITPENKEAIEKWRTGSAILSCKGYCVNKTFFNSNIGYWYPDKPREYTEISFEEFKVYTSKPKDLTGRYVKCLVDGTQGTRCKVGEIYKLVSLVDTVETQIYRLEDGLCLCISSDTSNEWELLPEDYSINKPLKQAVHCKSLEEYKLLKEKISTFYENVYSKTNDTVKLDKPSSTWSLDDCKDDNYQILSFQEWCDLNGYKMEKEVKFEVGKWYKVLNNWWAKFETIHNSGKRIKFSEIITNSGEYRNKGTHIDFISELQLLTNLSEIQQYLPEGHPDKIKIAGEFEIGDWVCHRELKTVYQIIEFDRDGWAIGNVPGGGWNSVQLRHATPEEINNHLISIGQIPAGKQVPEKYPFKPLQEGDLEWEIETPTFITNLQMGIIIKDPFYSGVNMPTTGNSYNKDFSTSIIPVNPKMILSINDEELPMVNIIKTNTIKQLLTVE